MTTAVTGPNYSVDNQISFVVQWFRTWSELQKEDFVEILAEKISRGNTVNGLVNGMQNLDTGSKRVSLFACQMKLFKEWWDVWSETERENLTARLRDSDPKFWNTVQEELSGTRKKLDDFFMAVNTNGTTATNNINANIVVVNGESGGENDNINAAESEETPSTNGVHANDNLDVENMDDEIDASG